MIVITDINAETEIINVEGFGHTPWTMWGRLADDKTAYSMNYKDIDKQLIKDADLIVLRFEESTWSEDEVRDGLLKVVSAKCPKICIIEGDFNGFRTWKKQNHQEVSQLFAESKIRMVTRDPRILSYYEALYPGSFFFTSLFEVGRMKAMVKDVK